ncbi:MAG: ribosome silencing factor [Pseudomonadales bacterium]|nr:ribosome silencing factor [Pseudomonadales bacterium]
MLNVELKELVLNALDELKGQDITCMDVSEQTQITDFMVVVSGTSNRHVRALVDKVIEDASARGVKPLGVEGEEQGEWVLIDLTDVVVHVMLPKVRDFYDLERLWTITPGTRKSTL